MAISPKDKYSSQIDTSDATGYPYGKAQNVTTAGDGTGTPFEKDWVNDLFGFIQATLSQAGVAPSGTPDKVGASQILSAILDIASRTVHWSSVETYAADALVFASNGKVYVSQQASNLNHDPTTDSGTWWVEYAENLMTPDSSFASPGYQRLPSGFIIQWGESGSLAANTGTTVTLPLTFPHNILMAYGSPLVNLGTEGGQSGSAYYASTSTIIVSNLSTGATSIAWLAIGY